MNNKGFSLIELAIVLIAFGLLAASGIALYETYIQKQKIFSTEKDIATITESMTRYFASYGHYPCPASFSTSATGGADGQATDCADTSVSVGSCSADYCVSSRSIDHDGLPATPNRDMRVRAGSVPFQALSIGTNDAAFEFYDDPRPIGGSEGVDGYHHRFSYVLTEQQGTSSYEFGTGGILIEDEFDRVIDNKADFVLISHGPDGRGSRTPGGRAFAADCSGQGEDLENCDFSNDAEYTDAIRTDTPGNDHFDDTLAYTLWLSYFLWEVSESDSTNINNINTGNVGVGTMDPLERLHVVAGNIKAEGNLYTQNLCNEDGNDCFSADLIGGSAFPTCGVAESMQGVALRIPTCVVTMPNDAGGACPANSYVSGFTYNTSTKAMNVVCKDPTTL